CVSGSDIVCVSPCRVCSQPLPSHSSCQPPLSSVCACVCVCVDGCVCVCTQCVCLLWVLICVWLCLCVCMLVSVYLCVCLCVNFKSLHHPNVRGSDIKINVDNVRCGLNSLPARPVGFIFLFTGGLYII